MPEFMAERRSDCARMMRGVYKNYELALCADLRATVKASQRKSRSGLIWLGAKLELPRAEQIFQMRNQLRTCEIGQPFVSRRMLLDVVFDDAREFLEQWLGRKRRNFHVVGGKNLLQIAQLSKNAGSQRAERNIDLAEQFGNQQVDFTAYERVGAARRHRSSDRVR